MISDVLFDAVAELTSYLEEPSYQNIYGDKALNEVRDFVSEMEKLARKLAAHPDALGTLQGSSGDPQR